MNDKQNCLRNSDELERGTLGIMFHAQTSGGLRFEKMK